MRQDHAKAVYSLAYFFYGEGNFQKANTIYSQLIQLNPEWSEADNSILKKIYGKGKSGENLSENHNTKTLKSVWLKESLESEKGSQLSAKLLGAEVYLNLASQLAKQGKFEDAIRSYQQAIEVQPQITETHYHNFWDVYAAHVRTVSIARGCIEVDPDFARLGFKQGLLPKNEVDNFLKSLKQADAKEFNIDDCQPGYLPSKLPPEIVQAIRCHTFLNLGSEQLNYLMPLLQGLVKPITDCLGTPWRIVNVIVQKTTPGVIEGGANAWHNDAFALSALKILIYLTGAGLEIGTTELKLQNGSNVLVEGPPGTWLLFKNSELIHRGIAPEKGERIIIQLTISPSLNQDTTPIFAGLNARHPLVPWY
ncbi:MULTISPECIES: tetratricopeptide repeat protein [unclassified Microcoleus]|uniref:tetratricopeptide repeat protein n=1 Tax=unclassified Microcoleus TaxID=2642155 RepID=UPI002FCF76DD